MRLMVVMMNTMVTIRKMLVKGRFRDFVQLAELAFMILVPMMITTILILMIMVVIMMIMIVPRGEVW